MLALLLLIAFLSSALFWMLRREFKRLEIKRAARSIFVQLNLQFEEFKKALLDVGKSMNKMAQDLNKLKEKS